MIVGGASSSISLPLSQCIVPENVNGPVVMFITSDSQPLINNVVNRATAQTVRLWSAIATDADHLLQIAGPTVAFIDIVPQLLGSLARGGSATGTAPAASTTQTISPEAAQSIIDGASSSVDAPAATATDSASSASSTDSASSASASATASVDASAAQASAIAANNVVANQFTGPTQDGVLSVNGWKTVSVAPAKRSTRFSRR